LPSIAFWRHFDLSESSPASGDFCPAVCKNGGWTYNLAALSNAGTDDDWQRFSTYLVFSYASVTLESAHDVNVS
jgi:hypothetical protein